VAEEKSIIFAVLAVIVLVTAVGLVYMIKGGVGKAYTNTGIQPISPLPEDWQYRVGVREVITQEPLYPTVSIYPSGTNLPADVPISYTPPQQPGGEPTGPSVVSKVRQLAMRYNTDILMYTDADKVIKLNLPAEGCNDALQVELQNVQRSHESGGLPLVTSSDPEGLKQLGGVILGAKITIMYDDGSFDIIHTK